MRTLAASPLGEGKVAYMIPVRSEQRVTPPDCPHGSSSIMCTIPSVRSLSWRMELLCRALVGHTGLPIQGAGGTTIPLLSLTCVSFLQFPVPDR